MDPMILPIHYLLWEKMWLNIILFVHIKYICIEMFFFWQS